MTPFRKNRPVDISSERFRLRSAVIADASPRWMSWAADPEVMGPLNAPPVQMPLSTLQQFIAEHDNERSYAIGIFTRTGLQIGFYEIICDLNHMSAEFKLLIGDKAFWGQNVVNETRAALLDHFFDYRKFEKAVGLPNARNFAAIRNYKAQGWRLEGIQRGQVKSVVDGRRIDQLMFGMLASEWRAQRKASTP